MSLRAHIELDAGTKTFATGLLIELIAALRVVRPGDLMAVTSSNRILGAELEAWCRFTRNSLVDVSIEQDRHRWIIRCGEAPAETDREARTEAARALGSRFTQISTAIYAVIIVVYARRRTRLDARSAPNECGRSRGKRLHSVWAR